MNKITWFAGGFLTCLFLAVLVPNIQKIRNPYGKIFYSGNPVEVTSNLNKDILMIGQEGILLPYGLYEMKLRSGKTLLIHKNNRGNIKVSEENGLVLIEADENVVDVRINE